MDDVKHERFLYPHIHATRKTPPDGLDVFLQPFHLLALLIRRVTTVRVLEAVQQRRSCWQGRPETPAQTCLSQSSC